MFGTAMLLASQAHHNQKDRGGRAYILHPIRIAMRLRTNDEELMSIAILHDAIEDSSIITLDVLTAHGFSKRVTDALVLLTHSKDVPYIDYITNMSRNKDALLVKREDLRDNSDITRLKGVTEKDFSRMRKYNIAFLMVEDYLELLK